MGYYALWDSISAVAGLFSKGITKGNKEDKGNKRDKGNKGDRWDK